MTDETKIFSLNINSNSEESKKIHEIIFSLRDEIGENAVYLLNQIEISFDPSLKVDAHTSINPKKIILNNGLIQFLLFHSDLIRVLDYLIIHRSEKKYQLPDGSIEDEKFIFSMAAYSLLAQFACKKISDLPNIHDILDEKAGKEVVAAVHGGICFILLHELGHIELGHLNLFEDIERQSFDLVEEESLSARKEWELAADSFAFNLIPSYSRRFFMPSITFLFGAYAFLEAFIGNYNKKYPLTINRLHILVNQCDLTHEEENIYFSWIRDRVESFRGLREMREKNDGSIFYNIEKSMPRDFAFFCIADIKSKII